jgi:PAS domain S-box-containing protein
VAEPGNPEEVFRQIAETIPEVFWITDPAKQQTVYISPAYEQVWGRSPASLYASPRSFLDAIHPEDRARVEGALARQGEGTYHEEYRIVRPDGSVRWIRDRGFPVRDARGAVYRIVGIAADITERAEHLKRSEERYRAVVENANEGIIVTQDGYIRFANAKALQLSARTPEVAYSTPFIEFIHPDDRARVYGNYLRRMRGEEVENQYNFRVVTPANEVRWLQISAVAIDWEGRPATLNFLSDVTAQVALQDSLKQALERERELSELKTRFVALASHEFRTPLAAILSSVELIEDFGSAMPEGERREVIGLIKGSVRRMTDMLEQILLVGRAEGRGLEFRPQAVDVTAMCERLLEEARNAARRPADARLEAGEEVARHLVDEKLLRHALGNLLANAFKYSPGGGRVTMTLETDAEHLVFRIADQGIGIPEEDQGRLFERFHRARNVGGIEGTGLGLAIVRQCVDLHGGTVEFQSRAGAGSTFMVRIPAPRA